MYSKPLFWDVDLYTIFIVIGVISAFVVFRVCADRFRFSARLQNLVLIDALVSIMVGFFGAAVCQAFYRWQQTGQFTFDGGITFLGGIIVGVALFLGIYFIAGRILFKEGEKEHIARIWELVSIGAAAITGAHAFGRIGCFFAGCCYGKPTTGFLGIQVPGEHFKRIPAQLYESAFLFILFGVLLFMILKKKGLYMCMPVYLVSYGIWRFFCEQFLRGDNVERGAKIIGLFPSQFLSVLLVIGGVVLGIILFRKFYAKKELDS